MGEAALTILLCPPGRAGELLLDELRDRHHAGLLRDALVLMESEGPAFAHRMSDPEKVALNLFDVLAEGAGHKVRIVRVVLVGPADDQHRAVDLRDRLTEVFEAPITLNLLVPIEDHGAGGSIAAGEVIPWFTNLVASPEDQAAPDRPATPIGLDRYIAHAAAEVATAGALWASIPEGPFDDLRTEFAGGDGLGDDGHGVVVFRSHSRSLRASALIDTVAGRVLHRVPPSCPSYVDGIRTAEVVEPDGLVEGVAARFMSVDGGRLRLTVVAPAEAELARYKGLLGVLNHLLDWVSNRLPAVVVEHAVDNLEDLSNAIERRIQDRFLGGKGSIFRLRLFPGAYEDTEVPDDDLVALAEYVPDLVGYWPYAPPAAAWRQLYRLTGSLADGGEVPDEEAQRRLSAGAARGVIADRQALVGPGDAPAWSPPDPLAELVGWDPTTWRRNDAARIARAERALEDIAAGRGPTPRGAAGQGSNPVPGGITREIASASLEELRAATVKHRQSLHWRIAASMSAEIDAAVELFTKMEDVVGTPLPIVTPPRVRRGFLKVLLFTVLLAVGVVLVATLPIIGIPYLLVVSFLGLTYFWSVVFTILGWVRDRYIAETRRKEAESFRTWAATHLEDVASEVFRLNANYAQFLDHSEFLGALSDDPLGPPARYESENELLGTRRLLSHQVANGRLSSGAFRGAVSALRRRIYGEGWFTRIIDVFTEAEVARYAVEHGLPTGEVVSVFDDPVIRKDLDPEAQDSLRIFLRDQATREPERFLNRIRLWDDLRRSVSLRPISEVIDMFGQGDGDGPDLLVGRDGVEDFLAGPLRAEGEQRYLVSIWGRHQAPGPLRREAWAPPLQSLDRRAGVRSSAVDPSQLLVQTLLVEWFDPCPRGELTILSPEDAAPLDVAHLGPGGALAAEPIPILDPTVVAERRRQRIVPLDDFGVGSLIEPSGPVDEPEEEGRYTFRVLVDGEPARFSIDSPIGFTVREVGGPPDALRLIRDALQVIADASGHSFRFDGMTTERPDRSDESASIWIGWIFPEEEERFLTGNAVGLGGSQPIGSTEAMLGGGVAKIKADHDLLPGFGSGTVGAVLLHELGHAMNLDHVDDPGEVMYPHTGQDPELLGPGDRRGLWLLGVGRSSLADLDEAPQG